MLRGRRPTAEPTAGMPSAIPMRRRWQSRLQAQGDRFEVFQEVGALCGSINQAASLDCGVYQMERLPIPVSAV